MERERRQQLMEEKQGAQQQVRGRPQSMRPQQQQMQVVRAVAPPTTEHSHFPHWFPRGIGNAGLMTGTSLRRESTEVVKPIARFKLHTLWCFHATSSRSSNSQAPPPRHPHSRYVGLDDDELNWRLDSYASLSDYTIVVHRARPVPWRLTSTPPTSAPSTWSANPPDWAPPKLMFITFTRS